MPMALAEAPVALVRGAGIRLRGLAGRGGAGAGARRAGAGGSPPSQATDFANGSRSSGARRLHTYALALDGGSGRAGSARPTRDKPTDRHRRSEHARRRPDAARAGIVLRLGHADRRQGETRYNPMSYHNGSIWPHDNALIASGFARYGLCAEGLAPAPGRHVRRQPVYGPAPLAGALLRVRSAGGPRGRRCTRWPALRKPGPAAAVFYLLQACLGLSFHSEAPRILFQHPVLPDYLERMRIQNLCVGDAMVELSFERHEHGVSVKVLRKEGEVDVSVVL